MMLVFWIILIVDYASGRSTDPIGAWVPFVAMALGAISQLLIIRDIKKKGRDRIGQSSQTKDRTTIYV